MVGRYKQSWREHISRFVQDGVSKPPRVTFDQFVEGFQSARIAGVTDTWEREAALAAVRAAVPRVPAGDSEVPAQVVLDGDDLLVTFRWPGEEHLFGVRFPLSEAPNGPSTGEACDSLEDWAWEISLVLMEELDTGLVHRGRRTVTSEGIVELDYRHDDDDAGERSAPPGPPLPGHHYRVVVPPDEPTIED